MVEQKRQRLLMRVRALEDTIVRLQADLPDDMHGWLDDAWIATSKVREKLENS